jgi:hypothetical protein
MATDWMGLLNTGINLYGALNTASKNQTAAQNYGNFTQFNPYNVTTPGASVGFQGNNAVAALSPGYQGIQSQLMSGAGGLFGNMNFNNGGINPFLQSSFDQFNKGTPGIQDPGLPANQAAWNTQQVSTDMGNQFNDASRGFLGGLGSFNSNQLAGDYTNNLRQQAAPQNQRAAESLAQRLFNSGRLGSTGGQGLYGELVNQQNMQDLQFQQAGRDYAGQEQNRLAGLAGQFGQLGTGINSQYAQLNDQFANSGFNRQMGYSDAQYGRNLNNAQFENQRAMARFQNAMSLFGAGQQNMQGQVQNGLGLLQGAQGLDQGLLQQIALGGNLGAARSGANQAAYGPGLEATVAKNNTSGAALAGAAGGILDSGLLSNWEWFNDRFGGGDIAPVKVNTPRTPGASTNPSTAGGEAAKYAGMIGNGLDVVSGIQQGGVRGYGQALAGGANLATQAGLLGNTTGGALSAAGNVASGNYLGAAKDIYGLFQGGGSTAAGAGASGAASGAGAAGGAGAASTAAPATGWAGAGMGGMASGMPVIAAAYAGLQLIDKAFGGGKTERRNLEALVASGVIGTQLYGKSRIYYMPDGRLIHKDKINDLADAYWRGAYEKSPEWQNKFDELYSTAGGEKLSKIEFRDGKYHYN